MRTIIHAPSEFVFISCHEGKGAAVLDQNCAVATPIPLAPL